MYLYQRPIDWALWALVQNTAVRVNSFFFFCGHIGPRSCKSAVVILFTCGYKIEYLIYFILPEVFQLFQSVTRFSGFNKQGFEEIVTNICY